MNVLYIYSLVKSLYDNNKDYIDAFWPIVLECLEEPKFLSNDKIKSAIEKYFGISIPEYSLQTIITRATRKGFLKQENKQTIITDNGLLFLAELKQYQELQNQKLDNLINDFVDYYNNETGELLDKNQAYELLLGFINKNLDILVESLNPESKFTIEIPEISRLEEHLVASYVNQKEKLQDTHYDSINNIIFGSIIVNIASGSQLPEINRKFSRHTQIYLDSNFLFSALGLHFDSYARPVNELLILLKKYKFDLRVFDFTITEMVRVLSRYASNRHKYTEEIKVNSIYSKLKSDGRSKQDVNELIQIIDKKISDLGITLTVTDIDINNYSPKNDHLASEIANYKPNKEEITYLHDLAVIDQIKAMRKESKRQIETSKFLFLTSDLLLAKFDWHEDSHREDFTITEVIADRLLTNILWFKDPSSKLPLSAVLSIYTKGVLVDRKVWSNFVRNLQQLKENGDIDNKDISMLFYNHYIEKTLLNTDNADRVDKDFVLTNVKQAYEQIDKTIQKQIGQKQAFFEQSISDKEKEYEQKYIKSMQEQKKIHQKIANKHAKLFVNGGFLFISIIFLYFIYLIYKFFIVNWLTREPTTGPVIITLAILGFSIITSIFIKPNALFDWRLRLIDRLTTHLLNQRIKAFGLDSS